jgi:phage-related protein
MHLQCSIEDSIWEGSTTVVYTVRLQDCRLVKLRGLMIRVKYGAVIGKNIHILHIFTRHSQESEFPDQSQRRI